VPAAQYGAWTQIEAEQRLQGEGAPAARAAQRRSLWTAAWRLCHLSCTGQGIVRTYVHDFCCACVYQQLLDAFVAYHVDS